MDGLYVKPFHLLEIKWNLIKSKSNLNVDSQSNNLFVI